MARCKRSALAALCALLAAAACSSDQGGETEPSCPALADQCPQGCDAVAAGLLKQGCVEKAGVIGCGHGGPSFPAHSCIKATATGDLYQLTSSGREGNLIKSPHWEECTQDEFVVVNAPPCAP